MNPNSSTKYLAQDQAHSGYSRNLVSDSNSRNTHRLLQSLAEGFEPISLGEMEDVSLQSRMDTKYIMSYDQLFAVLCNLQHEYRIMSVDGQRLNHYRTLYFDTPDFKLYNLHVNDRTHYYKVRSREYTDSKLSFFEVKQKTYKNRTIKNRIPTHSPLIRVDRSAREWLSGIVAHPSLDLVASIWNTFTRITLVSKQNCERVTLDVDLAFYNTDQMIRLNGIAVAEVKMDSGGRNSLFTTEMRDRRIHPEGFSKYCVGVSLLYPVKKNAMKPKLRQIEKIHNRRINHE